MAADFQIRTIFNRRACSSELRCGRSALMESQQLERFFTHHSRGKATHFDGFETVLGIAQRRRMAATDVIQTVIAPALYPMLHTVARVLRLSHHHIKVSRARGTITAFARVLVVRPSVPLGFVAYMNGLARDCLREMFPEFTRFRADHYVNPLCKAGIYVGNGSLGRRFL